MGRGMFQQCVSITRRGNADQEWRRITYVVFDAPTVRHLSSLLVGMPWPPAPPLDPCAGAWGH